jgi:DNA-binding CsgD family transcriptional regulator
MPSTETKLSDLIYAAASEGWTRALEGMQAAFRGSHVMLGVAGGPAPAMHGCGVDPAHLAFLTSPEAIRIAGPLQSRMPMNVAFANTDLVSDSEFERSAYYNELVRPVNGFYGLGALMSGAAADFALAICRPRFTGPFASEDKTALQGLLRHMSAALDLATRLQTAELDRAAALGVLDRLVEGVILSDAAGRASFVNTRAGQILSEADGLTLDDAGLAAATPAATRDLRGLIAAMASDSAIEGRRLSLDRPSRRPPLILTVVPITRLGMAIRGVRSPRIAIFIRESDAAALDPRMIAATFRLTPREGEVAALLAGGLDLEAIAARLGLGVGTVRNHLKHAFDKTGAHSQAALVALIRGIVAH